MEKIWNFLKDEDGLETVEYAIILGLIVVGTIAAVSLLGIYVKDQFDAVNEKLAPTEG
jgi:Flp pilus assembly pilin Flp